jgi:hypothetical protein
VHSHARQSLPHDRRADAGVFGGDVQVVWETFCRYFDVEPRIIALQPDKYTIGPEDVEPYVDENTIGVAAVSGATFTGHADDIRGINDLLVRLRDERGWMCRSTSTGRAAGSCGGFLSGLGVGLPARAGALDRAIVRAFVRQRPGPSAAAPEK